MWYKNVFDSETMEHVKSLHRHCTRSFKYSAGEGYMGNVKNFQLTNSPPPIVLFCKYGFQIYGATFDG